MAYPYDSDGTVKAVDGTNCQTAESVSAWYNRYGADLQQIYSMFLLNPECKDLNCWQLTGNGLSQKSVPYDPSGIGPDKNEIAYWLTVEMFSSLDTEVYVSYWRNQKDTGANLPNTSYLTLGTGFTTAYTISWRESFPIVKAKADTSLMNAISITNTVDTPATVTIMVKNPDGALDFNFISNTSPNARLTYTATGVLSASQDSTVLSGAVDFSSAFTLFTYVLAYGNYVLYKNDEDDPIARGNLGSTQRGVFTLLQQNFFNAEGVELKEILCWDIDVRNKYDIKTFRQDILKRFINAY